MPLHSLVKLLAAVTCVALGCSAGPERPHLFLVTADTLRADHLSHAGYPRETSPNLDGFAEEAVVYTQAVTLVPKTAPSFASHFTGQPPGRHGVTTNRGALPAEQPLLAEQLRAHGYATAAFVSNPILSRRKGFDRGFERYEEFPKEGGLDALVESFERFVAGADWRRPHFVWIHFIDPHGPYTPPAALRDLFVGDELFRADDRRVPLDYDPAPGQPVNRVLGAVPRYQQIGREDRVAWYVSQYDAEIRYMDAAFGRVLQALRQRGLHDGSGIVFTSDHGESLGEHDLFFEHGWFAYDASLRVPLLLKPPGRSAARRLDVQVSNLDTAPTLLAMAGVPTPEGLPGRDLLASVEPRPVLAQNPSSYPRRYFALRKGARKLVTSPPREELELYDLERDPGETRNLADREPDLARRMQSELESLRVAEGAPPTPPREVEPTPEEILRLRELGYLDPPAPPFDLQGHRGARGLHPENTLEGFAEALAIGVETLEMDTGVTRDGVVVVHHDERLDRDIARGGDGRWIEPPTPLLRRLTWKELQAYDVGRLRPGSDTHERFPEQRGRDGARVPRLADVLALAEARSGGRIRYNVETKLTPGAPEATLEPVAFVEAVLAVLREAGVESRATLQSFDWRTLRHAKSVAPELETVCLTAEQSFEDTIRRGSPGPSPWTAGLDVDDHGGSVPRLVQAAGCAVWSPFFAELDPEKVAASHALGLRVVPWTVNDPEHIEAVLDLGVDGIISDYPDRVRAALRARGRPLPEVWPHQPGP